MAHTDVKQGSDLFSSKAVWDQQMLLSQRNLVDAIVDFWPSGDVGSGLDVGCGDGKLTRLITERTGCAFTGLDSSAEALSRLQMSAVLADAANIPMADDSFDLVLSTDTLEHIPEPAYQSVWNELFRVAKRFVLVAVPFREELLDATARCAQCNHLYHANWHLRRYDLPDFVARAATGWSLESLIITGEPWSAMLREEVLFRRYFLDEWSGWTESTCPSCGSAGQNPQAVEPLSTLTAAALGKQVYAHLSEIRQWRSHSEILAIYSRAETVLSFGGPVPELTTRRATMLPAHRPDNLGDLHAYPQVARWIRSAETEIGQFPVYESADTLRLRRSPGMKGCVEGVVEDGLGILYNGVLLAEGEEQKEITLKRIPIPGYYGVLLRSTQLGLLEYAELGCGPEIIWASTSSAGQCYFQAYPGLRVQVSDEIWFDPSFLKATSISQFESGQLVRDLQNLEEMRDQEIDALVVRMQNLTAERTALNKTAAQYESALVHIQNLEAECLALRKAVSDHDRALVRIQNLEAENLGLKKRSIELDVRLAEIENLEAAVNDLKIQLSQTADAQVGLENLNRKLMTQVDQLNAKAAMLQSRLEVRLCASARRVLRSFRKKGSENTR
ncbi:MAG: methyltransferase domain-containing protein [Pseudomonadales bacterium]